LNFDLSSKLFKNRLIGITDLPKIVILWSNIEAIQAFFASFSQLELNWSFNRTHNFTANSGFYVISIQ